MAQKIPTTKLMLVTKYSESTDGYVKIIVYVPHTNKPKFKSTGYKIPVAWWLEDSGTVRRGYVGPDKIGADTINREIGKQYSAVVDAFHDALRRGTSFTAEFISSVLSPSPEPIGGDFMQFYMDHIRYLESRCSADYCNHFFIEYKQLKKFQENVSFADITASFLERYELSLVKYAATTRNSKMKRLKEVIDKAVERGHIERKAIAGYKWPAYDAPLREYLTFAETRKIADALYEGEFDDDKELRQVASYFLIECYSGIRFSDWTRFELEQLIDSTSFKVGQAQKNKQPVYLPLKDFKSLGEIVNYVSRHKILFDLQLPTVNRLLKIIATKAGIKKHLTTHIGRHTFGTLCAEKGYSTLWIAQAMAISEQTAKTYVKPTRKGLADEIVRLGGW